MGGSVSSIARSARTPREAARPTRLRLIAIVTAGALLAPPAAAQRSRALSDGVAAYNQVEYTTALMYLRSALRRTHSRTDLALALFYLGCTYLALEDGEKARESFETLLAFDPAFAPSRQLTSPKIARFFVQVRQSYPAPSGPPSMAHQPPSQTGGRLTALTLVAHNLSPRLRPILRYRSGAMAGYLTLEPHDRRGSRVRFAVPTPRDGGRLLYYFALIDGNGVHLQRLGSGRQPFVVASEQQHRAAPFYRTWWFWTLVGAGVAAGAGVAIGLTVAGGEQSSTAQVTILRRDSAGNSVPVFSP